MYFFLIAQPCKQEKKGRRLPMYTQVYAYTYTIYKYTSVVYTCVRIYIH
jgi:hypothetical protein